MPLLALLALLGACECGEGWVAELAEAVGEVEEARAAAADSWATSRVGARFSFGDAVRTGSAGTAQVAFQGGGRMSLAEDTLIRFLDRPPEAGEAAAPQVRVESGMAELEAEGQGIVIETVDGRGTVAPGARARVSRAEGVTRLEVLFGRVAIEDVDGQARELEAGQEILLELGAAVVEERVVEAAPAPPDEEPVAPAAPEPVVELTLTHRQGQVSFRATGDEPFRPVQGTLEVAAGGELQLEDAAVSLAGAEGTASISGTGLVVAGPGGGVLLEIRSGTLEITSEGGALRVRVPGGELDLAEVSGARVAVEGEGVSVEPLQGEVRLGGEALRRGMTAGRGGAGEWEVGGRPPTRADVRIGLGESPTIHDGAPPTNVRVPFPEGCADGAVEVAGPRGFRSPRAVSAGSGSGIVALPAGSHPYRVLCGGEPSSVSGRIRVQADRATRALSTAAHRNQVEADGRSYNVVYEGSLPEISFRWRTPPAGAVQFFLARGERRLRQDPAPAGRVQLTSGALGEGTYQFWFEGTGGRRTPRTTLRIAFDNTARTAFLSAPDDGSVAPGATTRLEGAVLPRTRVTVGGQAVSTSESGRFATSVTAPTEVDSIALRAEHPSTGVHYYLRHLAGTP